MKVIQLNNVTKDQYSLVDKEVFLKDKAILSVELSEYKESELVGSPHNILRHPNMPQAIFKTIWERLKSEKKLWQL